MLKFRNFGFKELDVWFGKFVMIMMMAIVAKMSYVIGYRLYVILASNILYFGMVNKINPFKTQLLLCKNCSKLYKYI